MKKSPSFKAVLKEGLSEQESQKVMDSINKMPGVLRAEFNERSRQGHYWKEISVTCDNMDKIKDDVKQLPGVVALGYFL